MEYVIRIGFKSTKNEVEYETLLFGLRVAIGMRVESLDIQRLLAYGKPSPRGLTLQESLNGGISRRGESSGDVD